MVGVILIGDLLIDGDGDGGPVFPEEPQALKRENTSRPATISSKERFGMWLYLPSLSLNDISLREMIARGHKVLSRPVFVETLLSNSMISIQKAKTI